MQNRKNFKLEPEVEVEIRSELEKTAMFSLGAMTTDVLSKGLRGGLVNTALRVTQTGVHSAAICSLGFTAISLFKIAKLQSEQKEEASKQLRPRV